MAEKQLVVSIEVLEAFLTALEGDGSTEYMPDVTPPMAFGWVMHEFDKRGLMVTRKRWWNRLRRAQVVDVADVLNLAA